MSSVVTTIVDYPAQDSCYYHSSPRNEFKPASSRMRRVASAPAFKHASAYQAPSAAAAVAQAQADAAAETEACTTTGEAASSRSRSSARRSTKLSSKLFNWGTAASSHSRPAASTVADCSSCSGGHCKCLEVYVVSRPFTEFGGDFVKNLPPETKEGMVDLGLCHYMTVFRTPNGEMVQFDFGPMGGDVQKAHGPLATFLRRAHASALAQANQAQGRLQLAGAAAATDASSTGRGMVHSPSAPMLPLASLSVAEEAREAATAALTGQPARQPRPKGVAGEIRERQLADLPSASMYMGRTQLSLAEIRQYNQLQGNMRYTLHDNDCRHYVNSLVQYATGVERSTQHLKRHYFQTRNADKWLWYGWLVSATQLVTDVGNWSHIQAGAAVTLLAVTGRSTLAQLKTLALPIIPVITRSMPAFIPSTGAAAAPGSAASATLKLPAALLLKRPLAGSAVAAAGGAGAAAAAIRTVPVGPDGGATAAAAATSGSGASSGRAGVFAVWGRSFKQWGDGIGQGLRGAVLTVRRLAVGHRAMVVEQLENAAGAQASAGRSTVGRRGWFGRRNSSFSGSQQLAQVGAATTVMALPRPAAAAIGLSPSRRGSSNVDRGQLYGVSSNSRQEVKVSGFMGGFGHHVGRHVLWLGSTASKATGTIAVLASKQMSYFINRTSPGQAAATAAFGGPQYSLAHSSSTGNLLCQQPCQQQQQQQSLRMTMGQRSKSAPSLALVAAAAVASSGPEWNTGYTAADAVPVEQPEFSMSDDLYGSGTGAGSVISSTVGGRQAGVGRQVFNLPAPPRLSWGRRASHAVIVGK